MSHFHQGFGAVFVANRDFEFDDTEDRHFRRFRVRDFDTSSDFDDTTD